MRLLGIVVLASACATTPAPAPPPAAPGAQPAQTEPPIARPTLESFEATGGLPSAAMERVVRERLTELAACWAFAGPSLERLPPPGPQTDDLVEVTLASRDVAANGDRSLSAKVKGRAEARCVERVVNAWGLGTLDPKATWQADAPVRFQYRSRPTPQAIERLRREHQASFDAFCTTPRASGVELRAHLQATRHRMKGRVLETFDDLFLVVSHAEPSDALVITAVSIQEAAVIHGLEPVCPALSGLAAPTTAELLRLPEPPGIACSERVAAMRAAAKMVPKTLEPPEVTSARALPVTGAPVLFRGSPRADPRHVKDVAKAEAARQRRARPIGWVSFTGLSLGDLVDLVGTWGQAFELRLLVRRPTQGLGRHAATAWPNVVAALGQRHPGAVRVGPWSLMRAVTALEDDAFVHGLCHGFGEATMWPPGAENDGDRAVGLLLGTADALEACGCPQPLAELEWARLALALDGLETLGFVPLNLTTDPKAPLVELKEGDGLQQLVDALRETPIRLTTPRRYFR